MREATNSDPMHSESSDGDALCKNAFVSGWPKKAFQVDSKASRPGGWFPRNTEPAKKRSFSPVYNDVNQDALERQVGWHHGCDRITLVPSMFKKGMGVF
jgi:hypothetical protein